MSFNWGIITGYTAISGIFNYQVIIPAYLGNNYKFSKTKINS